MSILHSSARPSGASRGPVVVAKSIIGPVVHRATNAFVRDWVRVGIRLKG